MKNKIYDYRKKNASNSYQLRFYCTIKIWPRVYKTFFMLNSVEHEILNARKYKNIKILSIFQAQ